MNPWLDQFTALLQTLFNAPKPGPFLYIQAGVALLFFLITFRLSGWALHVGYATWPRTLLTLLLVIGLPLGLTLAFQIMARPQLPPTLPIPWILGGMIGLLLLGIVLPLLTLLLKTSFVQILIMMAFSTFAAFVAALLLVFIAGAFHRGATDFSKAGQRREAIDSATSDSTPPTTGTP